MTEIDAHIDSLDRKIIKYLQEDSRRSFLDIARELGVAGGTVHSRVKRMQGMGLMKGSRMIVDPAVLGYKLSAFIGIQISSGPLVNQVAEQLRALPEVLEIHYTTGGFSLFIKILVRETGELYDCLSQKIQLIEGVHSTQTLIILKTLESRELQI